MKVIFLDNDGVICLANNWGSRFKKTKSYCNDNPDRKSIPVEFRFDNFDKKAIKILNEIIEKTDAEIVVSSDWKRHATLNELGDYFESQGIIKRPIDVTTLERIINDRGVKFHRSLELEQFRALEIRQWLDEHSEVTHWVAIDDLNMSIFESEADRKIWGLSNFVHTPYTNEGIKQSGIKDKILNFLI